MPENQKSDPLVNIRFLEIPSTLVTQLSPAIDPSIPIPFELASGRSGADALTTESMIAGMLRVLIYDPSHEHAAYYAGLVRSLRPHIKEEFTQAGMVKAQSKDFPVAIEIFLALKALFPDCPVTLLNLALVYHDAARQCKNDKTQYERHIDAAFHAYQDALGAEEVFTETHLNYGYFLLEQENYEKALAHFEYFLEHETDADKKAPVEKTALRLREALTQDGLFKEAFDYISMGDEETGILKAEELVHKNPESWNGWFLLGWGQRRLGRYDAAKSSFLKAVALTDAKPDLLNELAITHMELGELEASYRRLVEAVNLEPENTKVLSNLGIVCMKMGRPDDAKGFFRTALEFEPKDRIARQYMDALEKQP